MDGFSESLSQFVENSPPPKLKFAAAMSKSLRSSKTRSSPFIMSSSNATRQGVGEGKQKKKLLTTLKT